MLIIRHDEVSGVLAGRERDVVEAVRTAYLSHHRGGSTLPHSTFLRLPGTDPNRIIGLPAYLGGDAPTAGMKWIASFPGNLRHGHDRASALIVLNSLRTGHPEAVIEASLISAARTAASAALAASVLMPAESTPARGLSLIGCGVINQAIARYLRLLCPGVEHLVAYDRDPRRAAAFANRYLAGVGGTAGADGVSGVEVTVADTLDEAVAANDLISIATTATTAHMDLSAARPGATVLHISLRDLTPATVLANHNVVDDADHVCREQTSVHLAEQVAGDRGFIDASLAEVLTAGRPPRRDPHKTVIFSPFGLGVLDLAVAELVRSEAVRRGFGVRIDGFLPGRDARPARPQTLSHSRGAAA